MKPTTEPLQPAPSGKLADRVSEAAALLNVSATTIYELVRADTPPHKRLGRRIVIPARALEERLVALHQRDPKRAMILARYAERVHLGISEDVAAWPVFQTCPVCGGRGMLDDILCWRCEVRT